MSKLNEISFYSHWNGYYCKNKKRKQVGMDVEKRDLLCTVGGDVK